MSEERVTWKLQNHPLMSYSCPDRPPARSDRRRFSQLNTLPCPSSSPGIPFSRPTIRSRSNNGSSLESERGTTTDPRTSDGDAPPGPVVLCVRTHYPALQSLALGGKQVVRPHI